MSFFQICLFAIAGVLLAVVLKNVKPEYSQYISLGICIFIIGIALNEIQSVFSGFEEIMNHAVVFHPFLKILIKMIGVSYASEITKDICKDAGYVAIGNGIEILTRVLLCLLSFPILKEVLFLLDQYL